LLAARAAVWQDCRMRNALVLVLALVVACDQKKADGDEKEAKARNTADAVPSSATDGTATASAALDGASAATAAAAPPSPAPTGSGEPKADPSKLVIQGKPVQGGVVFAKVDGAVGRMEFPGHRAVVSDEGEFPVAFFRNAPKEEKMTIHFKDGTVLDYVFQVEQRTYETDKIDGLPEKMVKLDPETRKKVAEAEKRIDAVRMKYTPKPCYKDGFVWPVVGKITSRYGQPRILNGTDQGIHWGVDIAANVGTPVKAPACGTVVFAEANIPLSGTTMVIDHGQGLSSTFIHLKGFNKKVGDEVKQGDVVATVGMTGRTNGAHLDWRMNYFEIRTDPALLAPPMPGK
jgi:murein DD-endopeptidase MepM/ murein hydrolase activator NlpD